MSRAARLVLALLCAALLAGPAAAQANPAFAPFEFALIGDPQIGYGPGGEYADASRFRQVVEHVNAQGLPLAIVAGDLVQDRSLWQQWIYRWVARDLKARVLVAAGNHDVVDRSSLEAFRGRHGPDYQDAVVNDVAFVVIDSETARDRRVWTAEFDAQWDFIERSLAAHRQARRTHIVLVMHRPPFVDDEREAESDQNWPPATRERLLALARASGVRWILAGHLHRSVTITARGLAIVVGAGSARSFDGSPIAYQRFRVDRDGLSFRQVAVAPAPPEPFSVPGLHGWTPRLFDPSLRHWLFTLLYAAVGAIALARSRRLARDPEAPARAAAAWRTVALALFALGANMQLDIDEMLSALLRIAARWAGVFELRHAISAGLLLAIGAAAAFALARAVRRAGPRPETIALGLLAVPGAWFALSVASHHRIGMLVDEAAWDLMVLAALAGIAAAARRARRPRSV